MLDLSFAPLGGRRFHVAAKWNGWPFHADYVCPDSLLQCRLAGQQDLTAGPNHTMPWNIGPAIVKRPHNLSRRTAMACGGRDFSVCHHAPSRDAPYDIAELLQLHLAPVTSFSFSKKAFLRSVSSPQFTGGDW